MKHLRTLFFFLVFWVHQLCILPARLWFTLQVRRRGAAWVRPRVYSITHTWGRLVAALAGARVTVHKYSDAPPGETMLFVSNHQGEFDIPLLLGYGGRSLGFVAKKELAGIPGVSAWMRLMGCVFLDREDRRRQVAQVRETVETLQAGQSIVIFPEGTRSGSDEVRPFAKGSLNIARKAGVRIQPVSLSGSWRLKPAKGIGLPGGPVQITLHPPVDPAALSEAELDQLHITLRDQIVAGTRMTEPGAGV